MVGWTDLAADLSDHAALARLSAHLPARAHLISSDLIRARATADALASPTRTRLPDDPALREIHFGAWEMRGFAEVQAEAPAHIRAFWETPGDIAPPAAKAGTRSLPACPLRCPACRPAKQSWSATSARFWLRCKPA